MIDWFVNSKVQQHEGQVTYFFYFHDARGCAAAVYFALMGEWMNTEGYEL